MKGKKNGALSALDADLLAFSRILAIPCMSALKQARPGNVGCGDLGSRGLQKSDPVTHKSDIKAGADLAAGSDRRKAEERASLESRLPRNS